jgi:glycosyltransferase involved in cell wall biosynthesis
MLRLATSVSTWPFYNFRYRKLLFELARRFQLYVLAGSALPGDGKVSVFKLMRILPFKLPRRIRYYASPLIAETALNIVGADVVWLFDTASPIHPLLVKAPIVLDAEDTRVVLPKERLEDVRKLSSINELRLMKNSKIRKIVVTTKIIKRKLVMLGLDEEKISVIPYGVDTSLFYPTPLPNEPVVLYYGTFQPHRAPLLLKVVEVLARKRRDAKFLLIGDMPSPVRDRLLREVGSRVEMPGFVEHDRLPQFLQKARVCILPQDRSLGGRLSFKLLEYLACGRLVVATDVDESFPLKESGAGIVTEIDAEAMAYAIFRLLDDDRLAEELARKGVDYVLKYYWNKMVEDYIQLFYRVLDEEC